MPCGSRREHFTLPLIRFFSVSPSSNPLFCPLSLFIKFPFPSLDFLPLNVYRIQWCHYRHCLQANIHLFFRQGMLVYKFSRDDSAFLSNGNGYKRNLSSTFAVASIFSISGVTSTNIRSFGVHACSIHVTRVISFTLVNIRETTDTFCTLSFL